jgi:TatD DNase family protein
VIDTHAHLDACRDEPEALVARARAAGVDRIVAVGSGIDSCRAALAVAEREPGVYAALGIHPHQAGDGEAGRLAELRELLAAERAVAVGETGLDFYRDYAPRDRQLELFEAELALAADLVTRPARHGARARLLRLVRRQRHLSERVRPAGRGPRRPG